ncbi:MAG: hypothetical protein E7260_07885 [Lachnospiraceae bacterium]|nr:hypothetical protein [Lachnospiraceae bacterium]
MGIGLSGMISGLDTDAIVKAMVSAQQTKATKVENKITLNKWTTEAWSALNTKIYSFYTKYASKLRLQSSYMTRSASSSNESIIKATAGSTAAVGTHTVQVNKLASSQYVTGGQLKKDGAKASYDKNSKLTEMGVTAGTLVNITTKKGTADEAVFKMEVTEKTTVNDFLNACKDAGLTASFDTTQQRFFISSAQSGSEDAFSITTTALSQGAATIFGSLDDMVDTSILSSTEKTNYQNAMATLRQNTGVIATVLSDSYDASDKTQKSVMDAIDTLKNISVNQYADEKAKAAEESKLDQILADAALAAAADTEDTKATFEAYGKTYTYSEFKEATKAKMENSLLAEAVTAGQTAIKDLKLEALGEGYVNPATLTKTAFDKAQQTIADAATKATDAATKQTEYEAAQKAYEDAVAANATAEELEPLKTAADEAKAAADEAKTAADKAAEAATEAQKTVDTWNYQVTDAEGNTTTIGAVYQEAYDKKYDDGITEAELETGMKDAIISENKVAYDKIISEEKTKILADTANAADIAQLKADIETNLTNAAAAGTTASTGGLSALGLGEIDGSAMSNDASGGMVVIAANDAEIVLDGATMTETSNNFTVNGITFNLSDTTLNEDTGRHEPVQITVGKDGDSTYELIKEALTEYNKLIEEMNKLYNADSARGYDPLTDEQKEAMSETDIENWEGKIKGALLRRDDTLGSLLSSMRTALASTYKDEETGKTFSLSTFGIVTGNYTENGKLHIYGDADDATYATYEDRLKKALEEDPDQVMTVLTNVFGKLYETMSEKCAKTEISSALTFYNDKQYSKLLDGYEDDLETLEDRIKEMEDKYYKQFTAMEKALSKLQSQTNSLASLLGTNTQQ